MGNNLFEMTYNGTFTFSPEEKLVREVKRAHAWFVNSYAGKILPVGFGAIDFFGFWQLARYSMTDDAISRTIIVFGFLVAFELAPLYYGYAIGLECYNMGKEVHGRVKKLSLGAFLLGVFANAIYRICTYHVMVEFYEKSAFAITIVMILLPIITSLMSIVLGCLIFDPLLFEMNTVAKKLNRLNVAKRRLKSALVEYSDLDLGTTKPVIENEKNIYDSKIAILDACREELYTYVDWKVASFETK